MILGFFFVDDLKQLRGAIEITVSQRSPSIRSVNNMDVVRLVNRPLISAGLTDIVVPYSI